MHEPAAIDHVDIYQVDTIQGQLSTLVSRTNQHRATSRGRLNITNNICNTKS